MDPADPNTAPPNGAPTGVSGPSPAGEPAAEARGRSLQARMLAGYADRRGRFDVTLAGHGLRRVREIDLVNQALILAALAFMVLVPMLITVQAVSPLGSRRSVASRLVRRLGLSDRAEVEVQHLFAGSATVRSATTGIGALLVVLAALSWPRALQKGYELVWMLPTTARRLSWRPAAWLASFVAASDVLLGSSTLASSAPRRVAIGVISAPLIALYMWWTQYFLLGGRLGWRALLPGALATTVGLFGLHAYTALFLSSSITSGSREYGPIGVVFALLSFLIGFCVVMLGGALVGATIVHHSRPAPEASAPGS